MVPEIEARELSAALDRVAGEILERAGISGPPVNAFAVARGLGAVVVLDDRLQGRARLLRLSAGRDAIVLRSEPRMERRQWAIAHEIGEMFAYRVFGELSLYPGEAPGAAREEVANALAGRLLLPGRWFEREARECDWDLARLKGRFATASHELVARRMLDFEEPVIVTVFDNGGITLRASNVPGRVPGLRPAEEAARRRAHESGEAREEAEAALRVQAWPVHEPRWKREILRTEVALEGITIGADD